MRGGASILIISTLLLAACEKDFEERYEDNLEQLNDEAKEIKSGVDRQLAEGREGDKAIESTEEVEKRADTKDGIAR